MRRTTRGKGLLEPALAKLRRRRAERLIPRHLRTGRLLDVGCGAGAYFLEQTAFDEKYGIDRLPSAQPIHGVQIAEFDLECDPRLPFPDAFFTVVTMLAFLEHVDDAASRSLMRESLRVLKPGGRLVLTTPAAHADGLLRLMSSLRLVSVEEIEEHVNIWTRRRIEECLVQTGFAVVVAGYFEWGFNVWAYAEKWDQKS